MLESAMTSAEQEPVAHAGVGLGLRWSILDEVLDAPNLDIDFFEISPENYMRRGGYFPEALSEVAQDYPLRTHGLMMNLGGPTGPSDVYLNALAPFLHELGMREHSDHLCWSGTGGQILHDLLPLPIHRRCARRVADQVRRVQDRLGVKMAVENISYYAHLGPGDGLSEAQFIGEVLERADCGLLLDVNNVWVNAQNHGFDPIEYMQQLPLDRVVEMHVAGAERLPHMQDLWIDTHGAKIRPMVLELMQWVLQRRGAVPVLYERDHSIPPLSQLLKELAVVRQAYDAALRAPIPHQSPAHVPLDMGVTDTELQFNLSELILNQSKDIGDLPMPRARVEVYRQLVNNGLRGVCRQFMPRCAERRGKAFERDLGRWLAGPGPRSCFLRDLPESFFSFIEEHWREDPSCPEYLPDLGRHELIEFAVESTPAPPQGVADKDLELSDTLLFSETCCLVRYAYAVHELPDDPKSTAVPERRPTVLMAYRDQEHEVRFLELSAMAQGLVQRLMQGQPLGHAVLAQASEDAQLTAPGQVSNEYLSRVLALLGDLSTRGALLGPSANT